MPIADHELRELAQQFPTLERVGAGIWKGALDLHAVFEGQELRDRFDIEIRITEHYPDDVPKLFEVGNRTAIIARKYNVKDLKDLHQNPTDGSACVCVKQEEKLRFPLGSTLVDFVDRLATPYLYGLSYFDEYGKWPWPEFSHGTRGMLEWAANFKNHLTVDDIEVIAASLKQDAYGAYLEKVLRHPSENCHCVCGSGRVFRRCHSEAWEGVKRVRRAATKLGLELNDLFPK